EELAGVRRQRLDVSALAFGVQRVERERRLARAARPGDHDEAVLGELELVDLEVVLARALYDDLVRLALRIVTTRTEATSHRPTPYGAHVQVSSWRTGERLKQ